MLEKITTLFKTAADKFRAAFKKDDKLMKQVDEVVKNGKNSSTTNQSSASNIDIEKELEDTKKEVIDSISKRHADAAEVLRAAAKSIKASSDETSELITKNKAAIQKMMDKLNEKENPSEEEAEKVANRVVKLVKPIAQIPASKPLMLTDDTMTVKYRRFKQLIPYNIIYAGFSPMHDDTIKAMRKHGICDDDWNLKVSVDDLKKFMLNRKEYDVGTNIAYSTDSPEELIRSIFFIDKEYRDHSVKSLGGTKRIRDDYEWCKYCIPELEKHQKEYSKRINAVIEKVEYDIKKFDNRIKDANNENDDKEVNIYIGYQKRLKFQKYCLGVFGPLAISYAGAALRCNEEAYKMSKAALIRIVGGAHNFKESTIDRMVKVAMIETEMCFV